MKNSDMKIIAIILSIALFFTIVTSNAVSIASVVFLAKGQTAQEGTVGGDAGTATPDAGADAGTATPDAGTDAGTATPDAGTATPDAGTDAGTATPDAGTDAGTATPDAGTDAGTATPDAGTDTGADANKPAADANKPAADANKPAADANKPAADANKPAADANKPAADANKPAADANKPAANASPVDKEALAMYQKAAKEINTKGNATYNKKVWQAIVSFNLGSLPGFVQDLILEAVKGAMKTEDQAEDKLYEKGDDSKGHMAPSNCTEGAVASATKAKSGADTVVTIVMKDDKNPTRENKDGVNAMVTGDILYITDVYETVEGGALGKVIKLDKEKSSITYKAFTIKAVIGANGQFKSIDMKSEGHIAANINGSIDATGQLDFFVRYTNFKY